MDKEKAAIFYTNSFVEISCLLPNVDVDQTDSVLMLVDIDLSIDEMSRNVSIMFQ